MRVIPNHVACIMDGNGRWATSRGLPRTAGHVAGEQALAGIVEAASHEGIKYLTVFGFSTENWSRPRHEVKQIVELHRVIFSRKESLQRNNVRVQWIGRQPSTAGARTPVIVRKAIDEAVRSTKNNTGLVFTVAFDYGGRSEILEACADLIRDRALNSDGFPPLDSYIRRSGLPDIDLLIRTSGESRISNFLLWNLADAEIYITETAWPEFDAVELDVALRWYERRVAARGRWPGLPG